MVSIGRMLLGMCVSDTWTIQVKFCESKINNDLCYDSFIIRKIDSETFVKKNQSNEMKSNAIDLLLSLFFSISLHPIKRE